ncbi:hypothetical protein M569_09632 [Genlisea aurea]|uniref:xyloglucan:xyloglucosyl transferase n=1 Tax=Genlisea aurea TaxID=192259 RepID=S8CDU3_9LAMI|nr:hypothetical protein M569_09632 [Genlisea aurea]
MNALFGVFLFLLVSFVTGSSGNLPILSFDEGYAHLFGESNLMVLKDGKSVRISLDETTGSGFVSQDVYSNGFFSASVKLPGDYTAGVVVALYLSNADMYVKNHDEIDIEFLGNVRGKEWRIQTNVYGNGSTGFGREERCGLWFDPSDDFHQYSILWTHDLILFSVDGIPIREMKRRAAVGGDFPSKPMSLYATIWDASDWATNGGKYRVDYKYAPFVSEYSDFVLHGCSADCDELAGEIPGGRERRRMMAEFRNKYLQYSYCYDRSRYPAPPPECVIDAGEADALRRFDPARFGRRRRRGKRQQQTTMGDKPSRRVAPNEVEETHVSVSWPGFKNGVDRGIIRYPQSGKAARVLPSGKSFPFSEAKPILFTSPKGILGTQEKGRPLPKFGEWDVNNPASADGFTVIFAKARDDKKAKSTAAPPQKDGIPPSSNDRESPRSKRKWFCFF